MAATPRRPAARIISPSSPARSTAMARDRHGHRPLLRHGSRPALGAQQARVGCHRARPRRAVPTGSLSGAVSARYAERRDATNFSSRSSSRIRNEQRIRDGDVVLCFQLPRRPRPAALARFPAPGFRRLRPRGHAEGPLRHAHRVRSRPTAARSSSRRNRCATSSAKWSAAPGCKQLRIAETEKYPHVTYFFNGGVESAVSRRRPPDHPLAQGRADLRSTSRR